MDPTTVIFIIGFSAQTLTLLGLFWQNTRQNNELRDHIDTRIDHVDTRIDGTNTRIDGTNTRIDNRIDGLETRIDNRIDGLETRIDNRIDGLETRIDNRIDGLDTNMRELAADNKDARERLMLIQGRLGIGITVVEPPQADLILAEVAAEQSV